MQVMIKNLALIHIRLKIQALIKVGIELQS